MWLIPGKTKVRLELFKGVGVPDILVGIVGIALIAILLISNLPHKFIIASVILFVFAALLLRVDDEPNYIYILHILSHFALPRRYVKAFDDKMLLKINEKGEKEACVDSLFGEGDGEEEVFESPEMRKERLKAEREEYKADSKRLKAKDLTKEEEDAIWLKRAKQSEARKKERNAQRESVANWEDMENLVAFTGIKDDLIEYAGEYYGAAIEISPVEFRFLSKIRRKSSINNGIGKVLRALNLDNAANIVKIDRPVHFEKYLDAEQEKVEALRQAFEKGMMREDELKARIDVVYDRMNEIEKLMDHDKIIMPFYYLVLFDTDKFQLENQVRNALDCLNQAELECFRLDSKELALFLKYSNALDVNEKELDELTEEYYAAWAKPNEVIFKVRTAAVDKIKTHTMHITGYPTMADDAWLATVMSMPGTKCVVKVKPMDMGKAVRGIDRSLAELRSKYSSTNVDSKLIELQTHIESLGELLNMIQGENETLLDVSIFVTIYDYEATKQDPLIDEPKETSLPHISNMKKYVRRLYREHGLRLSNLDFEQFNAFVASQVSAYDPFIKRGRSMPSNTISASYPWVFATVSDPGGIMLGAQDGMPVFIDFFRRDSERVNSNMVIVGKSGSGKSYATKTLLAHLAADDAKIFILDPENEYTELAENLHGKFINVGNAQQGRLNPFHIMTAIDDEEMEEGTVSGSYATHLQFLEEFFKQILPDCDRDAMEYLNSIVDRMYTNMGIGAETDLTKLAPEDFPIFDDLYDAVLQEFQRTDNTYIRSMLRTLMNYISKFSTGGRNANIWNGPSTVTTDENFSVFNFQSLLSNRNATIANAQMLLVLKYIDNEIIKNRDYNTRNNMKRKVVVVIDEAHVFIDEKYPVALDFMFQLAKRIRKYNGMQIVITQNIKDFVGTEELARKSTAIINACQYSFVFPLAANDMDDLCKLYEKAGGINESEQEGIISAARGEAFTILSPASRSSFKVVAPNHVREMFENPGVVSEYFGADPEDELWLKFLQDSREKHEEAYAQRHQVVHRAQEVTPRKHVTFEEFTEEEFAQTVLTNEENTEAFAEENPVDESAKAMQLNAWEGAEAMTEAELMDEEDLMLDIPEIPENPEDFEAAYQEYKNENASHKLYESKYEERVETDNQNQVNNTAFFEALTEMNAASERRNREFQRQLIERTEERSQASERTEMLLAQILEKLTNNKMESDMQRIIEAEVEKKIALMMQGSNANLMQPAESSASEDSEDSQESSGGVTLGSMNIFGNRDMEDTTSDYSEAENESMEDDSDDDFNFDIMAILAEQASYMNEISAIEEMDIYGEEVVDITLEDLTKYIQNLA